MIVPEEVIAGESATFTIVLLPHWSATENGRTIQKEVTIDIPENFPEGKARLHVEAQYQEGDFFFGSDDFVFFDDFGDSDEGPPLPQNLDQFIDEQVAAQVDPGSILIILTPPDDFGYDFELPEFDFELPELDDIEIPELPEIPEFPPIDDVPPLDDLPSFEEIEPAEPVEIEIIIDDFILTGSKRITVDIKVPDTEDDFPPDILEIPIPNLPDGE